MVFSEQSHHELTPLLPSRDEGLQLLGDFLPRVPEYAAMRNFDIGDNRHVSRLSPYLRYRLVREEEVFAGVLGIYNFNECRTYLREVAWRTYWKGFLQMRPSLWAEYLNSAKALRENLTDLEHERWQAALEARTGIDCFDSWVRQLVENGWLHNHARMWFASIWIFTLGLPWQLGAEFFLQHLLDGDPASNTLSWRWVGGLHTKGKHYPATAENIAYFTKGAFNPEGQLNESASPLPWDGNHDVFPLPPVTPDVADTFPSLSQSPAGLLICPEDLSPERCPLGESPFATFFVSNAGDIMDSSRASPLVRNFINGAVDDAASRIAKHWSAVLLPCDLEILRLKAEASASHVGRVQKPRVYTGYVSTWVSSVLNWALNENLKAVWMMQPSAGPWMDAMPQLRASLASRNIQLLEYRDSWDSLHWPHATKGYFHFSKNLDQRMRS